MHYLPLAILALTGVLVVTGAITMVLYVCVKNSALSDMDEAQMGGQLAMVLITIAVSVLVVPHGPLSVALPMLGCGLLLLIGSHRRYREAKYWYVPTRSSFFA